MGKIKKGGSTGFFDKNGVMIHEGDDIITNEGIMYDVNCYLQAVPKLDGKAVPLKSLKPQENVSIFAPQDDAPEETVEINLPDPLDQDGHDDAESLKGFSNEALVSELRRRGCRVECSQPVTVWEKI